MKKLLLILMTLLAIAAGAFMICFRVVHDGTRAMQPTIAPQRTMLLYRFASAPGPGDVVVFRRPESKHRVMTRRVIAVAGQTVELRKKRVFVDGRALPQRSLPGRCTFDRGGAKRRACVTYEERVGERSYEVIRDATAPAMKVKKVKVPEGFVYVLGDNRDHSYDSRAFGPIVVGSIKGRVVWWAD